MKLFLLRAKQNHRNNSLVAVEEIYDDLISVNHCIRYIQLTSFKSSFTTVLDYGRNRLDSL